ncbi:MAG: NAD(P)H-dependent oxidoreductase [Sphaerochaetaceae bacterium]|nr:NAD(P)H-dependent oxidoreductase [Sphaerochaetaceae bacterium]
MRKVLVAFFSASGVTAKVAEELAKVEKADLFEIKAAKPYSKEDLDYTVKTARCNVEMADEACRPEIDGMVEDMAKYDTIFVGYPVWWGREPSIIDTFLDSYDLSGKKIVPFCTSAASPVDQGVAHIKKVVAGKAEVLKGKRLGANGTEEEVKIWTELLGL